MEKYILYQDSDKSKPLSFNNLGDVKMFLLRHPELSDGIASPCGTAILHQDPDNSWKVYEFDTQYLAFSFDPLVTDWSEFEGQSYLDNIKYFIEIVQDDAC